MWFRIMRRFALLLFALLGLSCAACGQEEQSYLQNLLKAARSGDAEAGLNLGYYYYDLDEAKALQWWQMAAKKKQAEAQCNLGICYANGKGLKQSYSKAYKWFKKAAKQGNAIAQYNLGVCYHNGYGTKQKRKEARKWYAQAATQGHESAKQELDNMEAYGLDHNVSKPLLDVPDEMPMFPGDLYLWLAEHVHYPDVCKELGVQGKVRVQFIINSNGSSDEIIILSSPNENLSKEAIRVVEAMPNWKPYRKFGKTMRTHYVLPITFLLE